MVKLNEKQEEMEEKRKKVILYHQELENKSVQEYRRAVA